MRSAPLLMPTHCTSAYSPSLLAQSTLAGRLRSALGLAIAGLTLVSAQWAASPVQAQTSPAAAAAAAAMGGGAAGLGGLGGAGAGLGGISGFGGFGAGVGFPGAGFAAGTPGIPQIGSDPTQRAGAAARFARPGDPLDPGLVLATMRPLPPLEPNAFQRFVEANSGQLLPVFGASLFHEMPEGFAPIGAVPVPADYVMGPGDEVQVRASGLVEFDLRLVIDREGQVVLPRVGPVSLAGIKLSELEKTLTAAVNRSFRNVQIHASLGQLRGIDVFVVGHARRPGRYTLSSLSSLVNAIFASGGPTADGSMRRIELVRAGKVVGQMDLYDFILRGDRSKDSRLLPGDTVVFAPAGPRVALMGAIATPAVYELSSTQVPLAQVLALAGGASVLADRQRAQLERVNAANGQREVEPIALTDAGLAKTLRDGDVVQVLAINPQFANAVTLRGHVAVPLRHAYTPGMRVRDLIPSQEALITRDFWIRRNQLVQFDEDPQAAGRAGFADPQRDAQRREALRRRNQASGTDPKAGGPVSAEDAALLSPALAPKPDPVRSLVRAADQVNWEYAAIERLDKKTLTTQVISFHLGRAVLGQDASQNIELQPGDVVTIFSVKDLQTSRRTQNRLVQIEGEVAAPGVYSVAAGETLPQLIARVGGFTPEAYLFGTALQRDSVRKQQEQNMEGVLRRLEDQAMAGILQRQANLTGIDAGNVLLQQQRIAAEERAVRERIARLRQIRPSGRVALELNDQTPELPAIMMEDGDRLLVPSRPSFVAVAGAVHNENVLVHRSGRNVKDYLRSAGPTESADPSQIFVLRADGSVVAPQTTNILGMSFTSDLDRFVPAPGDTIVVPEKIDRETRYSGFVRNLKDWTQLIYQLGLGAAAIKVLRD